MENRENAKSSWCSRHGLIPFVGTVASSIYFPEAIDLIGELQALYGCCILSFLGGIHWGLALMKTGTEIGMFLLI
jgi:hypothetical protein